MNPTTPGGTLEGDFYHYMHRIGQADPEANRRTLEFYVPYFARCRHVLDVGCGEGQFIAALLAQGITASGVDSDARMVSMCQDKGLEIVQADLFDYVPQHKGEFDGIFGSNLIEHLSMQDTVRFLEAACNALRPGGILLLATPNPESLIVHLYEFWRDATHVRLYSRSLVEFLLSWAGLQQVQSGENPTTVWALPESMKEAQDSLDNLPVWGGVSPWVGLMDPMPAEPERPLLRRVARSLRRRLARFLLHTVLIEEHRALNDHLTTRTGELNDLQRQLAAWRATTHQAASTLRQSHSQFLAAPREIFALGVKPPEPSAEQR